MTADPETGGVTAPASTHDERGLAMLATALGPTVMAALSAPDVIEILANPDGRVWIEREGRGREPTALRLAPSAAERVIRLVAALTGGTANTDHPLVSAELPPNGDRFEGVLPPVARAPCFAIRRPAQRRIGLDHYVAEGVMTAAIAAALRAAIAARENILIAGGTGSGKTTLANALLAEIAAADERIVILEDTRELVCAAADVVALKTRPPVVTLRDLVRSTLRLRPDRIIVGEVRGAEALDLLKAWNTGHPGGIATLHANSAPAALERLAQLCLEAAAHPPRTLIAEAIDVVVFVARDATRGPTGRRVEALYRPRAAADAGAPGLAPVMAAASAVQDLITASRED